ncbi:hypothetical protein AAFF_G00383530 [Aldrovandia affinis]|uniref:Plectin-like n=1 Tax=Aldrovandia affinis TaxID=143900 RepID=A0AAD7SFD5_9TELE|nr:hypothetical protein AAFF_G00383530 [Aldrovandia affinis]
MQESQDQATDEYARALGDAQTRLAQKEAELRKAAENHASEAEQLRCRVEQESRDTHQVEANALREQLAQLETSVEQEKAQNQELQAVQEKALRGESEKHGQQLKELRDQLEKSVEQEKAQNQELQTEQEVNRANSRLLEQLTERGQEKDKLQQELEATRKTADKCKAMLDELAIDVAQEKSRHKEELSDARLQHEKEVLGVRARYEKELRGLHEDKNRTEEEIRSQLRDEKARTRELESLQQTVEELQAQIQSMEGTKGWFERGLKEAEEMAAIEAQQRATEKSFREYGLFLGAEPGQYTLYSWSLEAVLFRLLFRLTQQGTALIQEQTGKNMDLISQPMVKEDKTSNFLGIRKDVTANELLQSKIIDKKLYEDLSAGKVTVQSVSKMDSVRNYLQGTNSIAGVFVQSTKQVMSIWEAKSEGLLTPGTSLVLLEAQAATGFMIDPVKNRKLTVEEAVAAGVVGVEWKNKLLSAERAVTGYTDPYTESTISLFQAMKKDLIIKDHGIRLLEAQIATGGIIDPVHSHRVPVEVAYQRGYFDEEMNQILLDPTDDTKGFFDPNTQENLTYLQLVERKDVTANELLQSKIIDKKLYDDLSAGKVTVQSVSKMDSVRNYLQGTNSIAGVFVQSTKQVMSIFEAKSKGLLTPGTSLVLLEAQAATGFMIDPVKNRKLTVEEAVAAGVVGVEWKNKLLSAERAVTGYTDPYTESTISLFQAMKKDLIIKNHGIRLLEAQIATGGIIDPVHSHRVPVEVAYQRGYFDEEMNQILLDPTDDTKGFF